MSKLVWENPIYRGKDKSGKNFTIDVTQSISAGLSANSNLVEHLVPWMKERGFTRILDFGAGALRHTVALLEKGMVISAVEYKEAFSRPKAKINMEKARKYDGFTELVWPEDFIKSTRKYDVILLTFVLQVVPVKKDRGRIIGELIKKFDRNGPKRLYYASRHGVSRSLKDEDKYNDGWIQGYRNSTQTFYTEWGAAETHEMMEKYKLMHAGNYGASSQPFIYELRSGL